MATGITKTTNYRNFFIALAPDCSATRAQAPPMTATPTVASLQYELLRARPYELTSDEVLFAVHAARAGIPPAEREAAWIRFFEKDQACLRASPLPKRYGWGLHHDEQGRVALVGVDDARYDELDYRDDVVKKPALRSSRKD